MTNLKYSIIIPTLNEEKLLPILLGRLKDESLRQKYNYEIIISDGGSADETINIALEHADKVKVHNAVNVQNIAGGRNSGARYAAGDILIFINGDVLINDVKAFFEFISEKFAGSNYPAMACKVKIFPHEEILSDKLFHFVYNLYFRLINCIGIGMGRGECQVIKKDVFDKTYGYNESLAAGEDFDLFRRIRKTGKILYANNICVYESPRRFRKLGYTGVTISWLKNAISILYKNKSLSKEWEQVR